MEIKEVSSYIQTTGTNISAGFLTKLWLSLGIAIPTQILGVSTQTIAVLVLLSVIDFVTGIIRAKIKGDRITSTKAANSLFKGLMYASLIVASWGVSLIFNDYVHIHFLAVAFLILVEFHSVLENITEAGIILPAPMQDWLKEKLNLHAKSENQ